MGSSPTSGIGRKAWMFVASKPRPSSARGKLKKKDGMRDANGRSLFAIAVCVVLDQT